jgi:C-terminal processing protease CtpA/Prc
LAANSERNFGGCGIDGVALPDGQIRVGQIVSGSPAHLAGIRIGDIITHIDGKATLGSDFRAMVQKRLRGVAGTPVVLKIRRDGEDKLLTFSLTRRQIAVTQPKEK